MLECLANLSNELRLEAGLLQVLHPSRPQGTCREIFTLVPLRGLASLGPGDGVGVEEIPNGQALGVVEETDPLILDQVSKPLRNELTVTHERLRQKGVAVELANGLIEARSASKTVDVLKEPLWEGVPANGQDASANLVIEKLVKKEHRV